MQNKPDFLKAPIFFEKNRVGRVYTGGALFADFFGDDSVDGFEPEEWVVSSVIALNRNQKSPKEGVSVVKDTNIYFDDLLKKYKTELLGDRDEFGVLTKVLDSAIRLPAQAHPDKAFSRKHFNSEYGKAESWIVLACRPDACIYFGFNKEYTKEEFKAAIKKSETDKDAMEKLLTRIAVKPGDVFFVPARMPHAIGKGCLILEIQEPSDFTIQPEYYCGDYRLSEQEMYIGLDEDTAIDVFDFSYLGEKAIELGRKTPKTVYNENGVEIKNLITYDDTPCFAVKSYTLSESEIILTEKPAVYVVTDGNGTIYLNNKEKNLKKGDYFFLPAAADEVKITSAENLTIIACLPPQK
ncbi:MAG: class I mannose-6-phosphate isomerase [Clostridia bacterium]|nr:class I mannose-6-phosphate isomerase [Clostridia bacterium]